MPATDFNRYYFPISKDLDVLPTINKIEELNTLEITYIVLSEYYYQSMSGKNRYNKYTIFNKSMESIYIEYKGWKLSEISNEYWADINSSFLGQNELFIYQGGGVTKTLPPWYRKFVALGLGGLLSTMTGKASWVKFYDNNNDMIQLPVHGCTYFLSAAFGTSNTINASEQNTVFYNGGNEEIQGGGNDNSIISYSLELLKALSNFKTWADFIQSESVQKN